MIYPTATIFTSIVHQSIATMDHLLDLLVEYCHESDIEPDALLNARLHPEMYPFIWQIQMGSEFAARAAFRLSGVSTKNLPSFPFEETTVEELKARLIDVLNKIESLSVEDFACSNETAIKMPYGPDVTLTLSASEYLFNMAIPNIQFHTSIAYAILRNRDVDIGKKDFIGSIGTVSY